AVYAGSRVGPSGQRGPAQGRMAGNATALPDIRNQRLSRTEQRRQLDFIQELNRQKLQRERVQPGIEGVIESYELAFRMQDSLPDLMDLSAETQATQDLYGLGDNQTAGFGRQCLLARRFVEAGVRF
ncbi:MAG: DUF1501 domain-containing protein, partial [Planctomycetaceae bacterium]